MCDLLVDTRSYRVKNIKTFFETVISDIKHFQILIFRNNAMEEGVNPFVPNVTFMEKPDICHVCTLPLSAGWLNLLPNFQKEEGFDRISIFREGLLRKTGLAFSGGVRLQFYIKG